MSKFVLAATAAFVLLVSGQAWADEPTAAVSEPPVARTEAPAEAPAPEPVAASAPAAKAKIVFFRPGRLTGAIYTYHVVEVGDDGKLAKDAPRLADLPNGGAAIAEVEPGVRSFNITGPMAVNLAEDRLRMEVEPGETYYVEQTVRIGLVTGGFRLVPADEARFMASKVKLKAPK
ncbi:MAG: hypothetical protein IM658_04140 [Phenylobacterium sp.]|uniref:hypothetical protein n=1 Tax=Phenylobacterium sp. TaxID=1871053 RepID=UPI0025FD0643|nr:hypothetical protein [Phenylobacterium sp.]MCA3731360.1 hypothetical protein [Phenylobacterium sp.]MCA6245198.1 hypothetical protein [Phenylobacterium sp.]MCA6282863.1 hypothetical protein [Phenylobacterium sp.]MCA6329517.1 hypothetical protein [Phenylobacterium sp.]MCA6360521.1 hypothetical protein [Phenylobacterium sp.]